MAKEDVEIALGIEALDPSILNTAAFKIPEAGPIPKSLDSYLKDVRVVQPRIAELDDVAVLAALGAVNLREQDTQSAYHWFGELARHQAATGQSLRAARLAIAKDERSEPRKNRLAYRDLQADLIKAEMTKPDGFLAANEIMPVLEALQDRERGISPGISILADGVWTEDFTRLMLHCYRRVVKLYTADPNEPLGSGFFVRASDVIEGEDDRPVVLTNHHVVHPENNAIPLGQIRAECRSNRNLLIQRFSKVLKESPRPMDYCVLDPVIISGQAELFYVDEGIIPDPLGPAQAHNAPRITQFGYPAKRGAIATGTSHRLIAKDETHIHYGAYTMPGLSGGPVCDLNFNVLALHRGSGPIPSPLAPYTHPYEGGEGTRISAIKAH